MADNPARRTTVVMFLLLLITVSAVTVAMVWPYLLAVTMGGILALLANPVYRLVRRRLGPKLSALVVTLGVIVVIIAPVVFFMTKAVQQAVSIGESLASGGFSFQDLLVKASRWGPVKWAIGDPQALETQLKSWMQTAGKQGTGALVAMLAGIPEMVLQLALASISCYFFLVDARSLRGWVIEKVPLDPDVRGRVSDTFRDTAISTIWATLAAAATQSAIMLGGYLALGVPAAFLAGASTFIFAWIPIVGSTPVWVAGVLYLYFEGSVGRAALMLALGIFVGIIDNFIRAMILKGRNKMHPLVSLVAIFGGIAMFGILGVFIGPILAAIFISVLQIWPVVGQRSGLLPETQTRKRAA